MVAVTEHAEHDADLAAEHAWGACEHPCCPCYDPDPEMRLTVDECAARFRP